MKLLKIEEKKIVAIDLWRCCCQNGRKKIVPIDLWEKKYYGNGVTENWRRGRERENCPDKKKSQSPHLLLLILFSMYFGIYSLIISNKPYKTYSTNMNLCDGFIFVFSFLSSF